MTIAMGAEPRKWCEGIMSKLRNKNVHDKKDSTTTQKRRKGLRIYFAPGKIRAMSDGITITNRFDERLLLKSRLLRLECLLHSPRFFLLAVLIVFGLLIMYKVVCQVSLIVECIMKYQFYASVMGVFWGASPIQLLRWMK